GGLGREGFSAAGHGVASVHQYLKNASGIHSSGNMSSKAGASDQFPVSIKRWTSWAYSAAMARRAVSSRVPRNRIANAPSWRQTSGRPEESDVMGSLLVHWQRPNRRRGMSGFLHRSGRRRGVRGITGARPGKPNLETGT